MKHADWETAAVDLHMHSALSPCADDFMTPGNMVGMAVVNNLDAIAVTDHNCVRNCGAAMEIGAEYGITVIPGMELETQEEIHVVCLFPDLARAEAFQRAVEASYTPPANRPEIFGCQQLFDAQDRLIGEHTPLLLAPTGLSIDSVFPLAASLDGIAYPAHVDRDSYSVLSTFGALPYAYPHAFVEISKECDPDVLRAQYPFLAGYALLRASDAHYLEHISERGTPLAVPERSAAGVIAGLRSLGRAPNQKEPSSILW